MVFKVSNINHENLGTLFHLYCPERNLPHKIMIFNNGTMKDDLNYKDYCNVEHEVRIAYNNQEEVFKIVNDAMVQHHPFMRLFFTEYGQLSEEYEILGSFFLKYNIKPKWINCNYTWGSFDDKTGHWTGAVGQVYMNSTCKIWDVG